MQNEQEVESERWAQSEQERKGASHCPCPVSPCEGFGFFSELNRKLLESFGKIVTRSDPSFHRVTLAAAQRREVMGRAGC